MGRIDATKLKLDPLKRIEPHAMKRRTDSEVYLTLQYAVTNTLACIDRFNKDLAYEERLKIFHVFLCALVRAIAFHPELNRFIAGRHYWQRNEILLSFVIKKELKSKSEETLTKIRFSPFETLDTVRKKIYSFVNEARSEKGSEAQGQIEFFGKLPRFMLMFAVKMIEILEFFGMMPKGMVKTDPLYTSAVIANLGSVRIKGGVLHHTYMYGTASLFVTINRIHKAPVVDEKTEEIRVEDVIDFGFTLDERISEGFSLGEVLKDFRTFIEHPELLAEIPVIPEDRLKELKLKNLENDPLYEEYLKKKK